MKTDPVVEYLYTYEPQVIDCSIRKNRLCEVDRCCGKVVFMDVYNKSFVDMTDDYHQAFKTYKLIRPMYQKYEMKWIKAGEKTNERTCSISPRIK